MFHPSFSGASCALFVARRPRLLACALVLLICSAAFAAKQDAEPVDVAFFEKAVRPILEEHCFDCHGPEKQKNKLRLDSTLGVLRGGESGEPLLLPSHSADSHLIKRITSTEPKEMMPPKGERLSESEVSLLRRWIDAGAPLPGEEAARSELKIKTDHWSYQPLRKPSVPAIGGSFARGEIDAFVEARMRSRGLEPSPPADRVALIRRLYLVMHGLPPSPKEVEQFLEDKSSDAYERLVDRVLASARYGERWARHWMDVVRYADTDGFERNVERKTAYPYRDYLIDAFNSDKPFNRFIKEQLAGDAFGVDAATGFLVAGPYDSVKSPDENLRLMQRQDELADMVNTTGTAFLGITMGCARCHNHKFDPIPQRDYYAVQAVFAGVQPGERPVRERQDSDAAARIAQLRSEEGGLKARLDAFRSKAAAASSAGLGPQAKDAGNLRAAVSAEFNEEKFDAVAAQSLRFTILATGGAEACLDEIEAYDEHGRNVALASNGGRPSASGSLAGYAIHKLEHINDGQTGNARSWISDAKGTGWIQIDFAKPARISRVVWSRDRSGQFKDRLPVAYRVELASAPGQWKLVASSSDRRAPAAGAAAAAGGNAFLAKLTPEDAAAARKLQADITEIQERISSAEQIAWIGRFNPKPERTHRLYRGEPVQKREVVSPDALSVLGTLGLDVDAPEQERRVRLGEWIASDENPLTARVFVNRLWHYVFGNGLVDTPSDFGVNGSRPTHPELLDWLAYEFMRSGWSVKHMQRLLLLSSTFQQSSKPRADALALDADGRFLWRYTPRRLEAEAIRDSMLAVSGALDLQMGGPGFYLLDVVRENVRHYFPKEKYTAEEYRRMVYLFRVRAAQDGVFGAFDCPDGGSVMAKRSRSNTPLQALNLFNSSFVEGQSELLAKRLRAEAGDSPAAQSELAFRLFYARSPDVYERQGATALITAHGLQSFARALYNTSEFLFVF